MFVMYIRATSSEPVSARIISSAIGLTYILPHVNSIAVLPLVSSKGIHWVIRILFAMKLLVVFIAVALGAPQGNPTGIVTFFFMNRVLTECVCRVGGIALSDLADEDEVLHLREQSLAGSIVGIEALLTRPFQSLAPLVGWALLSSESSMDASKRDGLGFAAAQDSGSGLGLGLLTGSGSGLGSSGRFLASSSSGILSSITGSVLDVAGIERQQQAEHFLIHKILVGVAIVTIAQIAVWNMYPLTGKKLQTIRNQLKREKEGLQHA